ncbi:anti-sigma factor RsbA family regulatory protein [Spirillospora sp. NPDC048911]|uniref:anti-sigma factor RsbA family regulatory protein n=1 Tax=Spirillospora sp. NPDC048911 TaxID=3364527 RepID=UPI0037245E74
MSETFSHRVLPYDGVDEFLAGAVPFLSTGIDAGDRVLAVTGVGSETLLREGLGPRARGVEFVEADGWYAHPSRTLADCLSDADQLCEQGRRLRILGEPAWTGRRPLEVLEWQRVEAIVNVAFARTGAAILCPYARTLPAGVVAAARRTHPETLRGSRALGNPGYVDPWTYSAMCDEEALPDPPARAERLDIERPDLFWLRAWVTDYARRTPLAEEDLQRLLVAVTEVVTNAIRHGAPPIVLRIWLEPGELVCEVKDAGRWAARSGFGLLPPGADGPGRFGLWAVRLLCSIVQIRTGDGTTVRLRLGLPSVPAVVRVQPWR